MFTTKWRISSAYVKTRVEQEVGPAKMCFKRLFFIDILMIIITFVFCEYFIYQIAMNKCSWPDKNNQRNSHAMKKLKTFFIADPHLLGPFRGHWFDKLRREWQMQRAFQASNNLLNPDVVFILGDLFDEGEIVDDKEWGYYMHRFRERIFYMAKNEKLKIVVGNHDIGFHGTILRDMDKWMRFKETFGIELSVNLMKIHNISFVTINSMSMKQDEGCTFCERAKHEIRMLNERLTLNKEKSNCREENDVVRCKTNGNAVLLQHFPLYRKNETMCIGEDGPSKHLQDIENKESWDVLSEESTDFILQMINPAFVLSGHAHHGCFVNRKGTWELSVPSFSWRNINNPSIVLGVFDDAEIILQKCYLPKESTVINLYIAAALFFIIFNFIQLKKYFHKTSKKIL